MAHHGTARGAPLRPLERLRYRGAPDPVGGTRADPARAEFIEEGRNRIVIRAETRVSGFLSLAGSYFSGREALVDGEPTVVCRRDHAMMVATGRGEETPSFR